MPSKSEKQHRFMNIAAHSKEFAAKVGISQDVAKEFTDADKAAGKFQKAKPHSTSSKPKRRLIDVVRQKLRE